MKAFQELIQKNRKTLRIPEDCEQMEAFTYYYKAGSTEQADMNEIASALTVVWVPVFVENEHLCICSPTSRFEIQICNIERVEKVHEGCYGAGWLREDGPTKDVFQIPNMQLDAKDNSLLTDHYRMVFTLGGEEFCFRFPDYELDQLIDLIGDEVPVYE